MMFEHRAAVLGFVLAFASAGCSDDSQLPPADLRPADAGLAADRSSSSEQPQPDLPSGPCHPACVADDISLCVMVAGGRCLECLDDSHCRANPGALGNRCDRDRNYCICDADADCAGNLRGPRCELANQMCVCKRDQDCKSPLPLCLGTEVRTCRPACRSDQDCGSYPRCDLASGRCLACTSSADCHNNAFSKECQVSSGRCVACSQDAHCPAGAPYCNQGSCVECKLAAHCQQSGQGSFCIQGRCSCYSGGQCQAITAWGSACRIELERYRCGCQAEPECAGKQVGPVCHPLFHFCTCQGDADCKVAPSTTCIFPSDTADYRQCQPGCATDLECQQRLHLGELAGFRKCAGGRCLVCAADADCAGDPTRPHCHPGLGRCTACADDSHCGGLTPVCSSGGLCVECQTDANCSAHPAGPSCKAGACGCVSNLDCAGPATWGKTCMTQKRCGCLGSPECAGKLPGPACAPGNQRCSCLVDAECKASPGMVCALPYAGATYRSCQHACQTAADCVSSSGLARCGPGGKCVACLGDADCGGSEPFCNDGQCGGCRVSADCVKQDWAKLCSLTQGCVECLTDLDCSLASLGKSCSNGSCLCSTHADCLGNLNGPLCEPGVRACSCLADADCPPPRRCTGFFFGAKICR